MNLLAHRLHNKIKFKMKILWQALQALFGKCSAKLQSLSVV